MEREVRIRMMGDLLVCAGGKTHDNLPGKSRKGVSLMQYLILRRGEPISAQRLIREMWSDRRSETPGAALKTMVSRVRSLLNGISPGLGECIVSGQGAYSWRNADGVSVDVLDVMDVLDRLRSRPTPKERAALTEKLLDLYAGDLYQTGDIPAGSAWVNRLHRDYLDAVYGYIEQLKAAEEFNRVCAVCRRAMQVDDLDEQLRIELMRAMVNLNRVDDAMEEYRDAVKQARRYLDAEPGEDMKAFAEQMARDGGKVRFNMDVIRNELAEKEGERQGPFLCDYRAFREFYHIQMRNLERLGSTMFLGVVMIGSPGETDDSVSREGGVAGLMEILRKNLRKGDIVTRYSENTVAMLLPTVNYSTGSMVMQRIEDLFRAVYPVGTVSFHSRISPLGYGN